MLLLIFHLIRRQLYFPIRVPMHRLHRLGNTLTALRSLLLRLSLLVFGLARFEVIDEDLADLVHGVVLGHASRLVLPDVHILAHLILLDFFETFFGHADVSFMRLSRLS